MKHNRFEGWYYKHQCGDDMVALIPGRSESGAFVQLLSPEGTRYFPVPDLSAAHGEVRAGNCLFSPRGCLVDLPGVQGELTYGEITPLCSDIMGPFRALPMECRHGVLSMAHPVSGSLIVDGVRHCFDGGTGYIEKDSGTSFPASYQWVQCNDFPEPCSLMLSIARIPFCGAHFSGCICAVVSGKHEFRLATYCGVCIRAAGERYVRLSQKDLELTLELRPTGPGHSLRAPRLGCMSDRIRECANAELHLTLSERGQPLLDLHSPHATYEYVPPR